MRSTANASSQDCDSTRIPMSGAPARSSSAARSPSSSFCGGICTSTTATSGLCARALRRKSTASPDSATTSNPASVRMRATPSRSSTSSSPITTGTATAQPYSDSPRPARRRGRYASGRSSSATKPTAPASSAASCVVASRSEEVRAPRQGRQPPGERHAVTVGQADVEQDGVGAQGRHELTRFADGGGLAYDVRVQRPNPRALKSWIPCAHARRR